MGTKEKLALLEDIMELDAGELHEEDTLVDLDNWDSMSKLSLIVLMDDKFSKALTAEQIKKFTTVRDILDIME